MVDVLTALTGKTETRYDPYLDSLSAFTYNGVTFQNLPYNMQTTLQGNTENIPATFEGYVDGALKSSSIVYTLEMIRASIFSEARSMYRRLNKGRPGDLFSNPDLEEIRAPGPNQTEGQLRARAILDADMAGNHFGLSRNGRIHNLRPDWMTLILGTDTEYDPVDAPDVTVVGYMYRPHGYKTPTFYLPDEIVHWAPMPDPVANYRGMSWITPAIREIQGDKEAASFKNRFYQNGATPNMIIKNQVTDPETFRRWVEMFRQEHEGVANAYKTLHLGAGADATVVGANFQQLDFKSVQGSFESRIAALSGVGAVMAQFSEGMQGSALNAGNYSATRRRVADGTFRPLWRSFSEAYQTIITTPTDAQLWYDERDIPFLREDAKDIAEIQQIRGTTIRSLVDAGFTPDSVVDSVANDDVTLLDHTALFSVQLQPPVEEPPAEPGPVVESEVDDE